MASANVYGKEEKTSLLLKAVVDDDSSRILSVLEENVDINGFCDFENVKISPIGLACKLGINPELVQILVEGGADVNLSGSDGKTPLHYVCEGQELEESYCDRTDCLMRKNILLFLISHGANINKRDNMGRTPLFIASYVADVELVRALIQKNCDVNINTVDGDSPVMIACRNAKYCTGRRIWREASHNAANVPPIRIVKMLMQANADASNATLLPTLVQYGNEELIKEFLDLGMNINMLDDSQLTPLGNSCFSVNVPCKIVKLLLERGADVNKGGGWRKQKPLIFAYVHNSVDKIRLLLSYGAKLTKDEMTELVSLSFTKSILENPEVIDSDSPELMSWNLLLAAGFHPNVLDWHLAHKLQQLSFCSSYEKISPWIETMLNPLYSLKDLCRVSIRNSMHSSVDEKISQLEIPNKLKDFLTFQEFNTQHA